MQRLIALAVALAASARADTTVRGIPSECQLEVVQCSTEPDLRRRPAPVVLSSVLMRGQWTNKASFLSPDGETLLVRLADGLRVLGRDRDDEVRLTLTGAGEPRWHPDGQRALVWVQAAQDEGSTRVALAVLDLARVQQGGARAPYDLLPQPPGSTPWAADWTPDGAAVVVVSNEESGEGCARRVPLAPGEVQELVRGPALDFAEPVDAGEGEAPPWLLVGQDQQLQVVGLDRAERAALGLPCGGIFNLAFSPDRRRNHVLLHYRRPVKDAGGRTLVGVWLVDLDAARATPGAAEQLSDATNVHTLWFSPRGTWATWASPDGVWFRRPEDGPDRTVRLEVPAAMDGEPPEVTGVAWSPDESRLAITAANQVWIHDARKRTFVLVATLGTIERTFCADPRWRGDRVVVASYTQPLPPPRRDAPRTPR